METGELRQGNIISYTCCCEKHHVIRVLEIHDESLAIEDQKKYAYCDSCGESFYKNNIRFFEPVPITEEWLLKFGFKKTVNNDSGYKEYKKSKGEFNIKFCAPYNEKTDCYINNTVLVYIIFVHQLQNLYFALTGEELILSPQQ